MAHNRWQREQLVRQCKQSGLTAAQVAELVGLTLGVRRPELWTPPIDISALQSRGLRSPTFFRRPFTVCSR
jgi:hypothetical protein